MPIVAGAILEREACNSCGGSLRLVVSPKNGKHYVTCGNCDFIADAEEKGGKWTALPQSERKGTGIKCLYCSGFLTQIKRQGKGFCFCPVKAGNGDGEDVHGDMIVFALETAIIARCECGTGYRYHDLTKKGIKVKKCSNKECDYFEWVEKRKIKQEEEA